MSPRRLHLVAFLFLIAISPAIVLADESREGGPADAAGEALTPSGDPDEVEDVTADAKLNESVSSYFTAFQKALGKADEEEVARLLWAKGIVLSSKERGLFVVPEGVDKEGFERGFLRGFENALKKKMNLMVSTLAYESFRLRRIEQIREGEVIAYVRIWQEEYAAHTNMRFWLLRSPAGGWRAYDYEDIEQNIRITTLIGVMLGGLGSGETWLEPTGKLFETLQRFINSGEPTGLLKSADAVLASTAPDAIKSIAHFYRYTHFIYEVDYENALLAIEEVSKLDPEAPIVDYGRGACHTYLGNHEEAIAALTAFSKKLGWDSNACDLASHSYFLHGDNDNAIKFAKKGLADTPESIDCIIDLALALPTNRIEEFHGYAEAMDEPEVAYDYALDYLIYEGYPKQAKALYKLLKAKVPDSELAELYAPDIADLK